MGQDVRFPFDGATVVALSATGTVTVTDTKTVVLVTGLGAAATITLATDTEVHEGSEVIIRVVQGGTGRNVTLAGVAANTPALTGVANDIDTLSLVYTGTEWVPTTAWQKTHDAA